MFSENLKNLRKQRGMSQEALAQQLNVVRQTISKWEKGLSVPDAEMLVRIADFFEITVSELLGEKMDEKSDVNEIAAQLALLNEQLAKRIRRNRKILKGVLIALAVVVFLGIMMCVIGLVRSYEAASLASEITTVNLVCTLDGEEYYYSITYDGLYNVVEAGGDEWVYDHVNLLDYDYDANVMIAQIQDYFKDRGGEVEISD